MRTGVSHGERARAICEPLRRRALDSTAPLCTVLVGRRGSHRLLRGFPVPFFGSLGLDSPELYNWGRPSVPPAALSWGA
eukprot:646048-Lingulodinium_polyedra.AAC.1